MIRLLKDAAMSLFVGVAVGCLLMPPAEAQDASAPYVPPAAPAGSPDLLALGTSLLVAAAIVTGCVMFLRAAFPPVFEPVPATPGSKLLNLVAAIVVGLGTGLAHVAPDVTGQGTLAGYLASGFLAACVATFGRDFAVRSKATAREAKERRRQVHSRKDAAEVTDPRKP